MMGLSDNGHTRFKTNIIVVKGVRKGRNMGLFPLLLPSLLLSGVVSEPATLHGSWTSGRSIKRSYHYSCTLPLDRPEDYVSVAITNTISMKISKTWGLEEINTLFLGAMDIVNVYQTETTVYPPRYVLHFHIESGFGGSEEYTPNCTWTILDAPLKPVTTTTTTTTVKPPIPITKPGPEFPKGTTGTTGLFGFSVDEACDYVNNNFVNGTPPTPAPSFTFPPRGPPGSLFPRGRRRRDISEYPEVNYAEAIDMSLRFYEAQRSGQLSGVSGAPASSIYWTTSTGLDHVTSDGRDLTGGWYNGNDKIKTTLPIAYSTAMLEWGYYFYIETYNKTGLEKRMIDTINWGLDYLTKCWDAENKVLYTQVGNLASDRAIWERFDNGAYTGIPVQIYNVTKNIPTADVAANVATAFAIAAVLADEEAFETNRDYMKLAKEVYNFARTNKGVADVDNSSSEYPTYTSSDYYDDLCLAAAWMYYLEYEDVYLTQADKFFKAYKDSQTDHKLFSWDDKYVACALMLYENTYEIVYQDIVLDYLQDWVNGPKTSEGFPDINEPLSLHYIANAAFIGLLAVDLNLVEDITFAKDVVTWSITNINRILGWNPDGQSYLIGYSSNYPMNPYHKYSACPNSPATCGQTFYDSNSSNTNILTGALVGGPDQEGVYTDTRQNKMGNSVMLDYNAGFQSALAGLQSYRDNLERQCGLQSDDVTTTRTTTTTTTTTTPPVPTTAEMRTRYTTLEPKAPPPIPTTLNYTDALGKSILFYMAQKGGTIPPNYSVTWRKTEMVGRFGIETEGWFDDGSNVKTTIAMASSTTLLGWGAMVFKTGYVNAKQLDGLHETLRASLNYLLECVEEYSFGGTVLTRKNGQEEPIRGEWARPSDERTIIFRNELISDGEPGADIIAETAATLALGSQVFKDSDANYSTKLLEGAIKHFNKIQLFNGSYEDTESMFFNGDSDAEDEKCLAALWLFRASGDSSYIGSVINSYKIVRQTDLSWKNKHVLCQILLYETTGQSKYQDAVLHFLRYWMESGVQYTPQGLAWHDDEGPLRYSANAAFVAVLAAELGINPSKSRDWARSQIDYMLGKNENAYSYLIGYGDRYPRKPHHRASSCPVDLVPCDWSVYNSPRPNPHILIGALVGGPNQNDFHEDARTNYTMNRVSVDYNAGFQSTLAALVELFPATTTTTPRSTTTTTTTTTTLKTTTKTTTTTTMLSPTTTTIRRPLTKPVPQPTTKPTTSQPTTIRKTTTPRPTTTIVVKQTTNLPTPTPNIPQLPTTDDSISTSSKATASVVLVVLTLCFLRITFNLVVTY